MKIIDFSMIFVLVTIGSSPKDCLVVNHPYSDQIINLSLFDFKIMQADRQNHPSLLSNTQKESLYIKNCYEQSNPDIDYIIPSAVIQYTTLDKTTKTISESLLFSGMYFVPIESGESLCGLNLIRQGKDGNMRNATFLGPCYEGKEMLRIAREFSSDTNVDRFIAMSHISEDYLDKFLVIFKDGTEKMFDLHEEGHLHKMTDDISIYKEKLIDEYKRIKANNVKQEEWTPPAINPGLFSTPKPTP